MNTMTYKLEAISVDDLSALDLRAEFDDLRDGVAAEIYRIWFEDKAEPGFVLFVPSVNRAGVAWGADAQWTDAHSAKKAVDFYIAGDMRS